MSAGPRGSLRTAGIAPDRGRAGRWDRGDPAGAALAGPAPPIPRFGRVSPGPPVFIPGGGGPAASLGAGRGGAAAASRTPVGTLGADPGFPPFHRPGRAQPPAPVPALPAPLQPWGHRSHRDALLAEKLGREERGWEERGSVPAAPGSKVRAGFFLELPCAYSPLLAFPPKNKMEKSVVFLCHLVHFLLIIVWVGGWEMNQGQFKYMRYCKLLK